MQSKQFDKVLKETIDGAFPFLMKNVLGIDADIAEELPDDIQHTKERKPDVLKRVTDAKGDTFVLHLEFQVKSEPKMVYRMFEYYAMLKRKYELPISQFVLYIGRGAPRMPTTIRDRNTSFEYVLINFGSIDYRLLLEAEEPEGIPYAVLGDFGEDSPEKAFKLIADQIVATSEGDLSTNLRLQQLRILSQIRNFKKDIMEAIMNGISPYVSEEKDFFFIKGENKAKATIIRNLLITSQHTVAEIAALAEVPVKVVEDIKKALAKSPSK